jgi:alpha-amylase
MTPTEIADTLQPVSAISIPSPISWADEERDLTAWVGNELQVAALDKLYSLAGKVNNCKDELIRKDWEYLQSSDHFYYMATKFFSDGAVHAYFNPYETPYDAFMNYMNVLSDFEIRLRKYFPDTAEQDQIFKMGAQLIEKDMIIEKQEFEIAKLTKKSSKKRAVKPTQKKDTKPKPKALKKDLSSSSTVKPVKKRTPKLSKTKAKTKSKTTTVRQPKKTKGSK